MRLEHSTGNKLNTGTVLPLVAHRMKVGDLCNFLVVVLNDNSGGYFYNVPSVVTVIFLRGSEACSMQLGHSVDG